jgi:hypothetical protein
VGVFVGVGVVVGVLAGATISVPTTIKAKKAPRFCVLLGIFSLFV